MPGFFLPACCPAGCLCENGAKFILAHVESFPAEKNFQIAFLVTLTFQQLHQKTEIGVDGYKCAMVAISTPGFIACTKKRSFDKNAID